jgi:hypothetical protein
MMNVDSHSLRMLLRVTMVLCLLMAKQAVAKHIL